MRRVHDELDHVLRDLAEGGHAEAVHVGVHGELQGMVLAWVEEARGVVAHRVVAEVATPAQCKIHAVLAVC